jgi:hypothetical protein
MTERSLFWDGDVTGAGIGDCGPYSQAHLMDRFFRAILNGTGNRGVLKNHRNELVVSGATSPLTVESGGVVCYGMFQDVDAAVNVSIPTPSATKTRYDRIVARRSWAAQQVRIARISGVARGPLEPPPTVPALVQIAGTTWDIPLAVVLVNDAGGVTLTDTREFCSMSTQWPAASIDTEYYAIGGITPASIPNRDRWELKGDGQFQPHGVYPCGRVAGASYDYWEFDTTGVCSGWAFFMIPEDAVGGGVYFYVWSTPHVDGAGIGAELCQWDYDIYYGAAGTVATTFSGSVSYDQQARTNDRPYRDALINLTAAPGSFVAVRLNRDGSADSYASDMELHGIEMIRTADC